MKDEQEDILTTIHGVGDLRKVPESEIPRLAGEIREFLIEHTKEYGGHLASNLGVVELTLALHRVFNTPYDRVIWDVGHQCYVHKMMTGRLDDFETLRRPGGLSGFTRRDESVYDPFGTGHSSTSISAALGFASADKLNGEDRYTVAVIGDGAMTGGLAHEAINNCKKNLQMIIVLNENEMSISRVTGAFPHLVSRLRISRSYRSVKRGTQVLLKSIPLIGRPIYRLVRKTRDMLRRIFYRSNFFEEMGFTYLGPYDGNNYRQVERALEEARDKKRCVIVHLRTQKGKGCTEAEDKPNEYHCIYPGSDGCDTFHSVFGEELCHMAERNSTICAVTPATGDSTGLSQFNREFPDRMFDVGIAEAHALTFSAGLCAAGMIPYAVIYSSFLQRGYDQILHDIMLQHLPVHIMIDRAALAPGDGATHHGIYDVAFLSEMTGLRIYSPATFGSLVQMMRDTAKTASPTAIRYPNGGECPTLRQVFYPNGEYGEYGVRASGDLRGCEVVLISYGKIAARAWAATEQLRNEDGIQAGMILLEKLTPVDEIAAEVATLLPENTAVVFLEEGIYNGGIGVQLSYALSQICKGIRTKILAIHDGAATPSAVVSDLYDFFGIGISDAVSAAKQLMMGFVSLHAETAESVETDIQGSAAPAETDSQK